jgi:hypothetical protein
MGFGLAHHRRRIAMTSGAKTTSIATASAPWKTAPACFSMLAMSDPAARASDGGGRERPAQVAKKRLRSCGSTHELQAHHRDEDTAAGLVRKSRFPRTDTKALVRGVDHPRLGRMQAQAGLCRPSLYHRQRSGRCLRATTQHHKVVRISHHLKPCSAIRWSSGSR